MGRGRDKKGFSHGKRAPSKRHVLQRTARNDRRHRTRRLPRATLTNEDRGIPVQHSHQGNLVSLFTRQFYIFFLVNRGNSHAMCARANDTEFDFCVHESQTSKQAGPHKIGLATCNESPQGEAHQSGLGDAKSRSFKQRHGAQNKPQLQEKNRAERSGKNPPMKRERKEAGKTRQPTKERQCRGSSKAPAPPIQRNQQTPTKRGAADKTPRRRQKTMHSEVESFKTFALANSRDKRIEPARSKTPFGAAEAKAREKERHDRKPFGAVVANGELFPFRLRGAAPRWVTVAKGEQNER
ncbi:hypothetical protein CDL15_Pgr001047 [Punica granatum]|uniref:Uncharacterized protein n=1 Tax=Punica granatum TaxID=22663 RepID=A0A218X0Q3_PUNGR|nr:hypothetical protein CDL15_Pgr001047 [Punica granatum]